MVVRKRFPGKADMTGFVSFVGAGPGDPDLITVRGLRALQNADVVLYDNLVELSALEGIDAELIYVGKASGHHSLPQEEINVLLGEQALAGKRVVRFKGGDPSVFGRVGEEALHVASKGIPFEIIPGVTSSIAGPMYAGIPVTHRGIADNFVVVTAHRNLDESEFSIPEYNSKTTLVLMMARGTVELWREQLLEQGYPKHSPIALVTAATSSKQQVVVTTVDDVVKDAVFYNVGMPTLAVAGNVVTLREKLRWFKGEV
jgi:uroporphyrin-III C-methyltransferase